MLRTVSKIPVKEITEEAMNAEDFSISPD
jgi:hypothetical protein